MANVSSSNGLEKRPRLAFRRTDGSSFPSWSRTSLSSIIEPYSEKVYGEHKYEVLTSSREGLQRQVDHFGTKQRHDTDGYNIIPIGYCTYRNRSDDGRFTFNINTISSNAIVSKFYPVFRFTNANSLFMSEFLNSSSRAKKKLSVLAVGTSQVVLSFEALKAAKFDLPCKDEQDKIASFFECLNRRIEYQRTLVDALKKYKRGLLRDVFSRLSASCDMRSLKDVSILFADGDWIESKDQASEGIRLVQTGNVGFGVYLDKPQNAKYISEATFRHLNCLEVCGGDILISRLPEPAGRACLLPETAERRITAVDCTVIRTDASVMDKNYLLQFLCSEQYLITVNSFLAGGTRQRISRKNLEGIKLPYPSINIQRHYGDFLSKVDARILNAEHQLNCLNRLRCFMLQQLFI